MNCYSTLFLTVSAVIVGLFGYWMGWSACNKFVKQKGDEDGNKNK